MGHASLLVRQRATCRQLDGAIWLFQDRSTYHTFASAAATKANEDAATAPKTDPSTSFLDVGSSAAESLSRPAAVIVCRDCRAPVGVVLVAAEHEGATENASPPPTRAATTNAPVQQGEARGNHTYEMLCVRGSGERVCPHPSAMLVYLVTGGLEKWEFPGEVDPDSAIHDGLDFMFLRVRSF